MQKETREEVKIKNGRIFNAPFQVPWQLFLLVPDAQGTFTLVEQTSEGLEMYFICTSNNALGEGGKEIMKFYSLYSKGRKEKVLHPSVKKSNAHFLLYVHLLQNLYKLCKGDGTVPILISFLDCPVSNAAKLLI